MGDEERATQKLPEESAQKEESALLNDALQLLNSQYAAQDLSKTQHNGFNV